MTIIGNILEVIAYYHKTYYFFYDSLFDFAINNTKLLIILQFNIDFTYINITNIFMKRCNFQNHCGGNKNVE